MLKFINKFKDAANQLCGVSEKLLFYGIVAALIILISSIIYYGLTGTYTEREIALIGVKTSFGIFTEFILAGIIFDCVKK